VAIVEGLTEQLFLKRLIEQRAVSQRLVFEERKLTDPQASRQVIASLGMLGKSVGTNIPTHYACLLDASGDGGVFTRLKENYATLQAKGYRYFITVRDVYPLASDEARRLRRVSRRYMRGYAPDARAIFPRPEMEAWFVAEHTHFARIDGGLTRQAVRQSLGFDLHSDDPQNLDHPAAFLDDAYRIAGYRYTKTRNRISRTVDLLDTPFLNANRHRQLYSYRLLLRIVDDFLA
jgi:hypothetical protein